jgi:DNA (cytosine-5)-methyltransferase 3A
MNVLSLFDGMSCGRIALERLGIKVDNYYASEIDKYAIQVSQANYPDIIQVGDVTELDTSTLPKIDLIMGGSPCQGFSFAGKQLAFDDPRSALFFEFVRCVEELKPKYFLLENVRMKKEYLDVISEYMGVEPIMINSSALVSAQNRVRYYWTNIPGIEQPEQRGIVLRDILETKEVEGLSDKAIDYMNRSSDKWSGGKTRKDIYIKHESEKGMCLTANMHKGVPYGVIAVDKPNQINPSKKANGVQPYMQDRVFHVDGKSHCLTKEFASRTNVGDEQEVYWRKLTPVECERLQTVPDNYTNHVSNTQRYKMLGNGWNIETITHILKNMEL